MQKSCLEQAENINSVNTECQPVTEDPRVVICLMAITSARRVSELVALRCTFPYLVFLPCHTPHTYNQTSIFYLRLSMTFTCHVILSYLTFTRHQVLQKKCLLHILDVKRALLFYLDRTKVPNRAQNLSVSYPPPHQELLISSQRLSLWIMATIVLSYSLERMLRPQSLTVHSAWAMAASTAFLDGVPLPDIYTAAIWSSCNTFIKHYAIDVRAK